MKFRVRPFAYRVCSIGCKLKFGTETMDQTRKQSTQSPFLSEKPEWLALHTEQILEPQLPIIDAHLHLWDRPGWTSLLQDLLNDTRSGHNVIATIFIQCIAMHRREGPEVLKAFGETEFANGVAAISASGIYGSLQACAGIVSYAE